MKFNKLASWFFTGALSLLMLITYQTNAASPINHPININNAQAINLAHTVKGIGAKRAEAIVKYRSTHGAFKSIDELANVPGLGNNFVLTHHAELEKTFTIK